MILLRSAFLWLLDIYGAYAVLSDGGCSTILHPSLIFSCLHLTVQHPVPLLWSPLDIVPCCLIALGSSVCHSSQNTWLLLLSAQALGLGTRISHLVMLVRYKDKPPCHAGTAEQAAAKPQTGAARAWPSAELVLQRILIRRSGRKNLTVQCVLLSRYSLLRRRAHGGFLLHTTTRLFTGFVPSLCLVTMLDYIFILIIAEL